MNLRGQSWLADHELTAMDEDGRAAVRARHVGFVFQAFHLIRPDGDRERHAAATSVPGVACASCRRRRHAARRLAERAQTLPASLSGGEQQRVAIARAFVTRPEVLSPTSRPATGQRRRAKASSICCSISTRSGVRRSCSSRTTAGSQRAVTHHPARCGSHRRHRAMNACRRAADLVRDLKVRRDRGAAAPLLVAVASLTAVRFFTSRHQRP